MAGAGEGLVVSPVSWYIVHIVSRDCPAFREGMPDRCVESGESGDRTSSTGVVGRSKEKALPRGKELFSVCG